jgi:eukaryotic-like serine/threonine-protein kinase
MIAARETTPDLAGTILEGAYQLVRLIGRGGMGAVYEATQLRLNKRVAVKLMSRESACDMVSLERFRREAEITSKLGHPHLVNLIDFGTAEAGQPYLVMEYLEGEDLDHHLQKTIRLPTEIAARIVTQSASALGAAHAQEVVHRDLKPANIFLLQVPGEPEFVKVLDFGISKVKAANGRRLTGVQSVVGTPAYMSPEQAMGRSDDTDPRADQWALACIAWEMLCGHPPFMADDTNALFFQIIRIEPASLLREAPDLRPAAETVLRRALSKRHTDRYPSIREFARAFEMAALGHATDTTPSPICLPYISDTNLSQPSATGSGEKSASAEQPALTGATGENRVVPPQLTAKIPRFKRAGWRLLTIAAAAIIGLCAAGTLLLRSPHADSNASRAPLPTMPRPNVVALPSNAAATQSPTQSASAPTEPAGRNEPSPAHAATERVAKSKTERATKPSSPPAAKAKHAHTNARTKHRLFEEL